MSLKDDHAAPILSNEKVSRITHPADTIVQCKNVQIGGTMPPVWMAGPCAIESFEQLDQIAQTLKTLGIPILRGGAFKPRTSPYAFQGLLHEGLNILNAVAKKHDLITVTEALSITDVEAVAQNADILQIGTRNMFNTELIRAVAATQKPILLKRGFMATIKEFLYAAEYAALAGADQLILCERGIRTFEPSTRNTLDIAAVAILQKETHFPIIVDVSHSLGRTDIVLPILKAVLAVGAHGVMIEVHPDPPNAHSDAKQQVKLADFKNLYQRILKKEASVESDER